MTRPEPVLSEAAISVPLGTARLVVARDRATSIRGWLVMLLLVLLPLVTYWPATFQLYGLRDDYSNLREAHEEPGKVVQFCASAARPIYGWLLQATYGAADTVQDLQWMRLAASLILGAIALVMFRGLHGLGWSFNSSLCFSVLLVLVPSAQVIAAWAVGWPYAITALTALGGFFTVEAVLALGPETPKTRLAAQWLFAVCLMVACGLMYQPSALFYVVPFTAAVISQRHRSVAQLARWTGLHLAVVVATLGVAYCIVSTLYDAGIFVKSGRVAFEHHWGTKAAWYFTETLPNAMSMFVLNDNNLRDHGMYLACVTLIGVILALGAGLEWRRHGRARGMIWIAALMGLPIFACSVSLVASERYATYRTVFAMTAVLLCFLVASINLITVRWHPTLRKALGLATIVTALGIAQHHSYGLIAATQGHEWTLIMEGAKQVRLGTPPPRIFAVTSTPADASTGTIYHDEFGSLSSNSEWVPKEMFKRAMHDLHPDVANLESRYEFSEGYKLPADAHFDVIIDMHQLRKYYKSY